ncbi:TonB-dependent receptor [Sphingomonas sp. KR1UV-12]|uniref:TonB-dependent receptor n=1 Tax=Sphingomonas aurea TaxID=3063994 RepID=A0ABT9EJ09_9SPHN|nr:TonB-dependent receptor [Sphingomonas sp. KR1UV-12]MDP1026936.1 TonB-dependent receptor [Sphingomonas sp. KR1UV-12]
MPFSTITRAALLAGAAFLVPAVPAAAQQADPAPAPAAAPEEGADIVVTGSRIRRPDYEAPNPIVSFDAAKIRESGNTNVTNFLQRVPALSNSVDSTRSAGNAQADGAVGQVGLNLLDLRGLGTNRTLVLVNGRRHVASQPDTAAVDINTIPTDLIERVDVLTGAASAVYGADGVSGVVNFILRRDFDGLAARAQAGISDRGDAGNRFASVIVGRNFAGGRANLTAAYEYSAEDPLANDDRDYLRSANRINFVALNDYDPTRAGSYQQGPARDIRYRDSSTYGYTDIGGVRYRGDGAIYTAGPSLVNTPYTLGGDDTPVAGYIGDILPQTERHAVNLLSHFDASDAFKVSLEGKFVQTRIRTLASYTGTYPGGPFYQSTPLDNPYIPQSILNAAVAAGQTGVDLSRNNFDLPRRGEDDRRRTWRGVADVTGAITDHASYDVSYTYGRTDLRATKLNDRLGTEFAQALDAVRNPATGQIVCRSAAARAAGCLPVNPFGQNTIDPASFGYFLYDPVSTARIEQHVANASLTGDFGQFFTLPGGPVQFAVGAEYRVEKSRFRPAQELVDGIFYGYDEYIVPTAARAKFDVWEGFGELNVPLLKDLPFAHLLSFGAAGRWSDYSTVGATQAYQFNGIWAPVADISFRGSYGRSVRAPNLGEFYRPRTGSGDSVDDPCYLANRGNGSQYRVANCQALIAAAGGNAASFSAATDPFAITYRPGFQQGNANLREETARTWTVGTVLRPRFVPGLQVGLDWYDIRIRDAISLATASDIAASCVDQPTTDNVFCALITRQAGTGYVSSFVVQPENVAAFRTAGLELNASYVVTTAGAGRFDLRLVGGYLHRLEQVATPGAAVIDNVDQPFRPKYSLTFSPTWSIDAVTVSYNLRWQNGVRRFDRQTTDDNPTAVDPRYFRFKELWQHDVQVQVRASERFALYAGVNNLGDQRPDIGFQTNVPISPLGRFFYAGARISLDR